ncbi:MAG: efflux RND transporter periplasmic adaptor subunit [Marinobacter sp.]|nr:efflux RND transporter periplasmic adaptor subunit [Marinobacter sp.]
MIIRLPLVLSVALLLAACAPEQPDSRQGETVPFVKTLSVQTADVASLSLSGEVRARFETPLAFQVSGRVIARQVDAGQTVEEGQVLFLIDPRDLEESLRAAEAEMAAAESAQALARADLERDQRLLRDNHISRQAFERSTLLEREARTRLDATRARAELARNALTYAELKAPAAGVLTQLSGELGQVVAAGQTIATLAHQGEREIEVFFPEGAAPPEQGLLVTRAGDRLVLARREVAGAVDPLSRTLRTRYRVTEQADSLPLGSIVRTSFRMEAKDIALLEVPVSALDERGAGPQVWLLVDGRAQAVPVQLVSLAPETARIRAELPPDARIIALGTHLLQPGMAVRELAP